MRKVLVVGDANVDIIVPFPQIIEASKKEAKFTTPVMQGGGTAGNTAVALARIDVETAFAGTVGNDNYGKFVVEDLKKEGVAVDNLIIDEQLNTVGVFAFIDDTGERYLWGWPREKQAFKEIDKNKLSADLLADVSWLHSSGMAVVHDTSARWTIKELFKAAYEQGITTSFDLNLRVDNGVLDLEYKEAVLEILEYTNYILGSGEDEFPHMGTADWLTNAQQLVRKDRTCIVRNGALGSSAITLDEQVDAPAFHVEVVDTVGAGDTYNAGFIKGILTGRSLKESLMLGNAVAGYTVSKKGARNCPDSTTLETFIKNRSQ
jgi:sugar/nucleoside kinase (ribokinase family)